jgi:hypothetical protein
LYWETRLSKRITCKFKSTTPGDGKLLQQHPESRPTKYKYLTYEHPFHPEIVYEEQTTYFDISERTSFPK